MRTLFMLVLGLGVSGLLSACGADESDENDGPFVPCGGNPEGSWRATALEIEEPTQLVPWLRDVPACLAGIDVSVLPTGRYLFGFDETFMANVGLSGTWSLDLDQACLEGLGYYTSDLPTACETAQTALWNAETVESGVCAPQGASCHCELQTRSRIETEGAFAVSGTQIMLGDVIRDFCSRSNLMQLQVALGRTDAVLVLERE